MLITSLLLFSGLATASRHGVRQIGCIPSPQPPIVQSTASTALPSSTPGPPDPNIQEPFLLQIQARNPQSRYKRQTLSGAFLENDSSTTSSCAQGAQFQLLNGRLLKGGVVVTISDPTTPQPFFGAGASGAISVTFSFTGGILSWSNPQFPRQTAFFCLLADAVFVYFDVAPQGCVDITIAFSPLSACQQTLPSTAASTTSTTLSTLGSQLSPASSSPTPAVSGIDASSSSAPSDAGTTSEVQPPPSATEQPTSLSSVEAGSSSEPPSLSSSQTTRSFYWSNSTTLASSQTEPAVSEPSSSEAVESSQEAGSSSSTILSTASSENSTSMTTPSGGLFPTSTMSSNTTEPPLFPTSTMSSNDTTPSTSSTPDVSNSTSMSSEPSSSSNSSSATTSAPSSSPTPFPPPELLLANCVPTTPENFMGFGFNTDTAGSIGYSGLATGGVATGDYIAFYGTYPTDDFGFTDGFLYHQRSGLCVTAVAPDPPTDPDNKYTGASVELQPCGPVDQATPEAQLFTGINFVDMTGMAFRGEKHGATEEVQYYGSATGADDGVVAVSLSFAMGFPWFYNCDSGLASGGESAGAPAPEGKIF